MKKLLLLTIISIGFIPLKLYSQVCGGNPPWCTIGNALIGTDVFGSTNNQDVNFITGNTIRMQLVGTAGPTIGFLGIGSLTPNFHLEVADDINLLPATFPNTGYRWQDSVILKTNNVLSNIFLGVNAGNNAGGGASNTFLGAFSGEQHSGNSGGNTFIGWNAANQSTNAGESVIIGSMAGFSENGNNNCYVGVSAGRGVALDTTFNNTFLGGSSGRLNSGDDNVFIGSNAGQNNTQSQNTFVGFASGNANTTGNQNVFLGANSGNLNTAGRNLTFLGFNSGVNNSQGANNTFSGSLSGQANTLGNSNSFMGSRSGLSNDRGNDNTFIGIESGMSNVSDSNNTFYGSFSGRVLATGSSNTFIGGQSGVTINVGDSITLVGAGSTAANGLTNAVAIGSNADVRNSNTMILGNNNVNVGIGLSGDATGPTNKLEINHGTSNNSGLTFTSLTTANMPAGSSSNTFLTVDVSGKVILKDLPSTRGSISSCGGALTATNYYLPQSNNNKPESKH